MYVTQRQLHPLETWPSMDEDSRALHPCFYLPSFQAVLPKNLFPLSICLRIFLTLVMGLLDLVTYWPCESYKFLGFPEPSKFHLLPYQLPSTLQKRDYLLGEVKENKYPSRQACTSVTLHLLSVLRTILQRWRFLVDEKSFLSPSAVFIPFKFGVLKHFSFKVHCKGIPKWPYQHHCLSGNV